MSAIKTGMAAIWASPAAEAMARALVHFLWQGALVGIATGGILVLLDKARASTRYAVALGALFLMAALPIATASRLMDRAAGPVRSVTPVAAERVVANAPDPVARPVSMPAPMLTPIMAPMAARVVSAGEARKLGVSLLPWIFRLWLAGVAALSLFHLGGWSRVRRLPRQGRPAGQDLQALARGLGSRLGIGRAVALLESTAVSVPMVVGWLQPVVLVPASVLTGLPPSQLAAVLAHELAHVRRHDYLVNLLQTAVETLLFYHPAVWWVSAQVRRERENCCDDLAVGVCGDRLGYARALANLEGLRAPASPLVLAASGGSLVERIRRLVGAPVHRPRQSWMAGVLALSLLPLAGLEISHASGTPDRPDRKEADPPGVVVRERIDPPGIPVRGTVITGVAVGPVDETPAKEDLSSQSTWKVQRRGDKIQMFLRWGHGRSRLESSFSLAANQLAGLTAGPEVRFELRRDAGTFRFEGRFEGGGGEVAQGTGSFTFEGNPAYIGQMANLGYALRDDRLMEYAAFDVSYTYALGLLDLGYGKLTGERLLDLRIRGVTPEFIQEIGEAGYRELSPERLVEFRINGIDSKVIREWAHAGLGDLRDERQLRLDLTSAFIQEMADAGYRDLSPQRLSEFRFHGIDAEFVRKAASEGYRDLSPEELLELKITGKLERGRHQLGGETK
jgi:beta-lactamase regulating signal transducer with metallopeptidase domain